MNGQIIILAAGKGTRIGNSELPKVLLPVLGQPMIEYVLKTIGNLNLKNKPLVVVGFQGEKVKNQLGERADFVWQKKQLGTGHAVACAKDKLKNYQGPVLVLYGDHPLISAKTINDLFNFYFEKRPALTMMTTEVKDFNDWRSCFYSFGRILQDEQGNIKAIRELKDCLDKQKEIKEVNPGYYCFDSDWLWKNIDSLKNNNQQKEYYLTDLIEIVVKQDRQINSIKIEPTECLGVNTWDQLKLVERIIKNREVI